MSFPTSFIFSIVHLTQHWFSRNVYSIADVHISSQQKELRMFFFTYICLQTFPFIWFTVMIFRNTKLEYSFIVEIKSKTILSVKICIRSHVIPLLARRVWPMFNPLNNINLQIVLLDEKQNQAVTST